MGKIVFNPFTGKFDYIGFKGTLANTQVAFGTAANTIGGSSKFTWDNSSSLMTISDSYAGLMGISIQNLSNNTNAGTILQLSNDTNKQYLVGVTSSTNGSLPNTFIIQDTTNSEFILASDQNKITTLKANKFAFTQNVVTTGTPTGILFTGAAHTTLANADTNDIFLNLNRTVQLSGGGAVISLMRSIYIKPPTYSAAAAQTITNLATLYIEDAPFAGLNVTINARAAAHFKSTGSSAQCLILEKSNASQNVPQLNVLDSSGLNNAGFLFSGSDGTNTGTMVGSYTNHPLYFIARGGVNTAQMTLNQSGFLGLNNLSPSATLDITQPVSTSGTPIGIRFVGGAHTGLTAGTEVYDFYLNATRTLTFQTGNIQAQENVFIKGGTTYAFAGASTITVATTHTISRMPVAGSNATITYAICSFIDPGDSGATNNVGLAVNPVSIKTGFGNATLIADIFTTPSNSTSLGDQVATLTNLAREYHSIVTYTSTGTRTVTNAATLMIEGAPVAGTGVTFTNPGYSIWVKADSARFDGRILGAKGANVTAANDLTLGNDGNTFKITGNTQVNAITTSGWTAGSRITLIFTGTPTVKHNTAGGAGTATLLLASSLDLTAANNTVLGLVYDGTNWQETFRKAA